MYCSRDVLFVAKPCLTVSYVCFGCAAGSTCPRGSLSRSWDACGSSCSARRAFWTHCPTNASFPWSAGGWSSEQARSRPMTSFTKRTLKQERALWPRTSIGHQRRHKRHKSRHPPRASRATPVRVGKPCAPTAAVRGNPAFRAP